MRQYQKLFEMEGAELEFTPTALREIARMAKERDTGARGLRSIVEEVMTDIMFELPDIETEGEVHRDRRGRPRRGRCSRRSRRRRPRRTRFRKARNGPNQKRTAKTPRAPRSSSWRSWRLGGSFTFYGPPSATAP